MSRRITREEIDRFHDYGIYVPTRTLYCGSEAYDLDSDEESGTDGKMAERIIKNLRILEALSSEPIIIIMDNVGGDFYHGGAVWDQIKLCKSHTTIQVMGHAMSMGSVILQAADTRVMAPNAKQMIHYGETAASGHPTVVSKWVEEDKKLNRWMEQMYLEKIQEKNPNFKLKKLKEMLSFDTILTAQESIDLGLADKILGEKT